MPDPILSSLSCPPPRRLSFARRFGELAGGYWRRDPPRESSSRFPDPYRHWRARIFTVLLVVLTIGQVLIPVGINLWSARLFDALEQRSLSHLPALIGLLGSLLAYAVLVNASHLWVKRRLMLGWRQWLTRDILRHWMEDGRQYRVIHMPGVEGMDDNPDGRIAEDIRVSTEAAIDLCHSLFYCLLLLGSFVHILWSLSGIVELPLGNTTVALPGSLVGIALLYAAAGTTAALLLARPLVRAVNRRQTCEANFRFGLIHARENAETIALLGGENNERRRLYELFQFIREAWTAQSRALRNIIGFTSGYSTLSTAFPILVVAPRYMEGLISLGTMMQTAQAFQQVSAALSWPIDNLARVAEWRASVERVLALKDAVSALSSADPACLGRDIVNHAATGSPVLTIDTLRVDGPDGRPLIEPFSAVIKPGDKVLIAGDPLAALRLFKVMAGLWPWGQGSILAPSGARPFFVPRRPYLLDTVHETLAYPDMPGDIPREQVVAALTLVGLDALIADLDTPQPLGRTLTVPDQKRLGFARLFARPAPTWIFIQEATDALDEADEHKILDLLHTTYPHATVISVGSHRVLESYFPIRLTLIPTGTGAYRVHKAVS